MNVTAQYTIEINKINDSIKSLLDRKVKLPLIAKIIEVDISKLQVKKNELELELKKEIELVDAYIENILHKHNSLKYKLK